MMSSAARGREIALLVCLTLLAISAPADATTARGPATVRATAAQMLRLAEQLLRRGRSNEAQTVLELLTRDPDSNMRNEARYKLADLQASDGKLSAAAVLLRQILDERPDAAPARLQLAAILGKMGDEDSALRQLRALRSGDLSPQVARFVDRLAASLQANKPLGFQLELALAPDTNVNRATRSDTLGTVFGDFVIDEHVKSGVGAAVRGLVQTRLPLSDGLQLAARAASDVNIYRESDFNDITLDFAAGPDYRVGQLRMTAEVGGGQQWYGMKPYQRTVRLAGSVSRPLGAVSQVRLDIAGRLTDNKFNDLQDGHGIGARLQYERAISPELLLSLSAGADRFKAMDDAYSTKIASFGLNAYRDLGRMTLTAGVELGWLKADERLQLLPEARADRITRVSFGAVFRRLTFAGFAPMTRVLIERNKSNVEFYDYKRIRTEIGISRAF